MSWHLNQDFIIKGTIKKPFLFNLKEGSRFYINKDQFDLILSLPFSNKIYSNYFLKDRENLKEFIGELINLRILSNKGQKPLFIHQKNPILEHVHLDITNRCNLKCLHCYQERYLGKGLRCYRDEERFNNKELNFKELKSMISRLSELGVFSITISGGEPFIRKDILDFLSLVEKNKIRIGTIITNGTLLTARIVNFLKKLKSNPYIIISLDGLEETNDYMRGKGSFRLITHSAELISKNNLKLLVNTVVHKKISINLLICMNIYLN